MRCMKALVMAEVKPSAGMVDHAPLLSSLSWPQLDGSAEQLKAVVGVLGPPGGLPVVFVCKEGVERGLRGPLDARSPARTTLLSNCEATVWRRWAFCTCEAIQRERLASLGVAARARWQAGTQPGS